MTAGSVRSWIRRASSHRILTNGMPDRPGTENRELFWPRCAAWGVIGLGWLIPLLLWISPGVTLPDGVGYFEYLPSAVLDGNLDFFDDWQKAGLITPDGVILFAQPTRTGLLGTHWPCGSATWWLPAFVLGHVSSLWHGSSDAHGFDQAHIVPPILASALAGLIVLVLSWTLARRVAGNSAAAAASLGVWFGSPLLFYSIRNSLTSHAVGALACAACVGCAVAWRCDPVTSHRALAFGLAAGFAFAVRPQNAPFALVPLFLFDAAQRRTALRHVPLAALGALAGSSPQLIVSTFLYGSPWGFLAPTDGVAPFERVFALEPILSWYHGMVPWTPVLGLAVAGFILLYRSDRGLGLAAVWCFATEWAINATLDRSFWGGYAFGQRRFDNCTVFFVLGLAALIAWLPRWVGGGLVLACSAWTTSLVLAVPRFDLNRYQPPSVLLDAQLATLRDPASWLRPLGGVPVGFRLGVLAWIIAMLACGGVAAWGFSRMSSVARLYAAAAWVVGSASIFLVAGLGSRRVAEQRAGIVSLNRSLGIPAGVVQCRLGLLQEELHWLESTDRAAAAARTRAEIDGIERQRRERP